MAKKATKKATKKVAKKVEKLEKVNGIAVPEGASNDNNPVVPIENAVNPTSPIYQSQVTSTKNL